MNPVLLGVVIVAYVLGRRALIRWTTDRWLDDQFSNRQAGALFLVASIAPLIATVVIVLWSAPDSIPIVLIAIVPVAVLAMGLTWAAMDYMAAYGTKASMQRARQNALGGEGR